LPEQDFPAVLTVRYALRAFRAHSRKLLPPLANASNIHLRFDYITAENPCQVKIDNFLSIFEKSFMLYRFPFLNNGARKTNPSKRVFI
ncbi:MAG: hypothetical protein K2L87_07220, partial [Clostridiales bacterium]|nr:hypothetical protein [Clostridiales bacterium]